MAKSENIGDKPGDRLRWAREQRGLSRADAAEALRVPYATYASHENGHHGMSRQAARYATFYRISLDWLLTGRGQPRGRSEIEVLYDELPADARRQALDYLEFLKRRHTGDG